MDDGLLFSQQNSSPEDFFLKKNNSLTQLKRARLDYSKQPDSVQAAEIFDAAWTEAYELCTKDLDFTEFYKIVEEDVHTQNTPQDPKEISNLFENHYSVKYYHVLIEEHTHEVLADVINKFTLRPGYIFIEGTLAHKLEEYTVPLALQDGSFVQVTIPNNKVSIIKQSITNTFEFIQHENYSDSRYSQ